MRRRSPGQRVMVRNVELIEDFQRRRSSNCIEYWRPTIYPTLSDLCNALPLLCVKVDMTVGCYDCLIGHPTCCFEEFSKWLITKKRRGSKMATSVEFSVQMLLLQEQRRIEVPLEWNLPCPLFLWFLDNRKAIEEINGAPLLTRVRVDYIFGS